MATQINFPTHADRKDYLLKQGIEQTGTPGPPNELGIGTVTTLGTGQPATAQITGSFPNQKLNLGLPKGDKGEPGRDGRDGQKGETGSQGVPGPAGSGLTPNGYGPLTEAYIAQVEAGGVDWLYVVTTDQRTNKNVPATLSGDQARNIISYDTDNGWHTIAPFTGVEGPPGIQGKEGPPGRDGRDGINGTDGAPGINGTNGTNGVDGKDGKDGAPGPKSIDTYAAISTANISFAEGDPDIVSYTATGAVTWTFSGFRSTGLVSSRILAIRNGASGVQTFPSSAKWAEGKRMEFSTGLDFVAMFSYDGGATVHLAEWSKDSK